MSTASKEAETRGTSPAGGSATETLAKRPRSKRVTDKDFLVGAVLGDGAFSKVLQVQQIVGSKNADSTQTSCGRQFAMKIVEKKFIERHKKVAVVMMERNVLMRLSHPNVVKLHVAFKNDRFLFFGLDLCEKGTLLGLIVSRRKECEARSVKDEACSLVDTKFYALELIRVLEYIHGEGIIHRDLKPENVLIKKDGHIMVADFGTAKDERSTKKCNTFCGTAEYVSPEVLRDEEPTAAADFWAVGCILFQLYIGRPPFRGQSDMATFEMITSHEPKLGKRQFEFPHRCGPLIRDALDSIFCQNPKKRLCGPNLRGHPFFFSKDSSCSARGIAALTCTILSRPRFLGGHDDSRQRVLSAIFSNLLCVDVDISLLRGRAPDLPDTIANKSLPPIEDDGGLLADFEIVLAKREMREVELEYEEAGGIAKVEMESPAPFSPKLPTLSLPSPEDMDAWQKYLDCDEKVLMSGLVVKKRYRFTDISAKNRQLILTSRPRLIYLEPETNTKRGEIPWNPKIMEVVLKHENPGCFDIKTPHRTYYLRDMLGNAKRWQDAIHKILGRPPTPQRKRSLSPSLGWW